MKFATNNKQEKEGEGGKYIYYEDYISRLNVFLIIINYK